MTSEKNEKRLTKKDIQGLFWRSLPMEFSWHYERQMHMGFTFMLAKILQKLYGDDKEKLAEALQRHMEFFNCTPALSSFIGGIVASMEEKNANDLLGRFDLFASDVKGLYALDAEMAARTYTAPSLTL